MNDHFKRQAEQFLFAAKEARIPDNVQAMALDSVARSREVYDKLATAAKDQARLAEELTLATQAGMKLIGNKMVENTVANTEAAFDAAQAIARASTMLDAMRLQSEYVQRQLAIATAQTKELVELSTRVATQTFETANEAVNEAVSEAATTTTTKQRRRA